MKFIFLIPIFMAYIPIFMVLYTNIHGVMSQLKPTSVRFTGLLISKASFLPERFLVRTYCEQCKNFWKAPIVSLTDREGKVMWRRSQALMLRNVGASKMIYHGGGEPEGAMHY